MDLGRGGAHPWRLLELFFWCVGAAIGCAWPHVFERVASGGGTRSRPSAERPRGVALLGHSWQLTQHVSNIYHKSGLKEQTCRQRSASLCLRLCRAFLLNDLGLERPRPNSATRSLVSLATGDLIGWPMVVECRASNMPSATCSPSPWPQQLSVQAFAWHRSLNALNLNSAGRAARLVREQATHGTRTATIYGADCFVS